MDALLSQFAGAQGAGAAALAGLSLVSLVCPPVPATWIERRSYWPRFTAFVAAVLLLAVAGGSHFMPRDSLPLFASDPGDERAVRTANARTRGEGFNCGRYMARPREERTPQRDTICMTRSADSADKAMSGLFRAWRNDMPSADYRAITKAHIAWLESRNAHCPADWGDLAKPLHRRAIGVCLETETRRRIAGIEAEIALLAKASKTASAAEGP